MKLERVGLIVNPSAGGGHGLDLAGEALNALAPREILTGAGEMGADAPGAHPVLLRVLDWGGRAGKARTEYLVGRLAAEGVDAIILVGGDGTLADAAFTLYRQGHTTPLLGIGAGSANVGPLMTCRRDQIPNLAGARLELRTVDGLVAGVDDVPLGLGFNDVVIGFTVLATVDGAIVDVDAAGKMAGRNVPRDPESIGTPATTVVKTSPRGETPIAQGDKVATIIAGFGDERFYGKAIAGGVLLSGLMGDPAGCLVCDHLLVRTQMDPEWYRRSEPVISYYASLGETDRIQAWGLRPGTALCADGNPLALLGPENRAQITVRRALAQTVQIRRDRV